MRRSCCSLMVPWKAKKIFVMDKELAVQEVIKDYQFLPKAVAATFSLARWEQVVPTVIGDITGEQSVNAVNALAHAEKQSWKEYVKLLQMEALEEVAEEYRWLLQPNIENLQVNKIYALPREELGFVPKHNNFAHDFLLTSQRLQILKTVSGSMGKKAPGGFIFAGAHGTSKSTLGLLLASFAWANKYGLIFISGAEIRSKGEQALLHNYLLHNTRNRARWPEFLQEALYNPGQYPNSLIEDFKAFLWKVPEARLIIVDEHNELWRGPVTSEHLIARHWEHSLFGPRAFTIFIGSAHSKFLQNLPDGYDRFVVHVDPWTWEEFTCISTSFPTINAALSCSLSRDQVESITGLLPRLLHGLENELRSGGSAKTFEAHQARLWRSRLDKLHRSERLIAGIRAVLQLIPGHGDVLGPAALIFDLGLVKLDKQARQWIPLCNLAKLVMVDYVLATTLKALKSSQGDAPGYYILERALGAWHCKSQIRVPCLGNKQVFYQHDIQTFARIVQNFAVEPQAKTLLQSAGSVLFWPREGFQLQYVDWIVVNHHTRTVDFCALSKTFLSQATIAGWSTTKPLH
eukprot:TRINITY_DN4638_c0_g1_i3.p1 TRINITY_DN4638_c0_g1~~TRINITY_DN4638_c0_g1_i3.p1  ORF type:complete len:574 (-),score=70.28 TRINITY_DN4638_c0_g1_i3:435-2156(-)